MQIMHRFFLFYFIFKKGNLLQNSQQIVFCKITVALEKFNVEQVPAEREVIQR